MKDCGLSVPPPDQAHVRQYGLVCFLWEMRGSWADRICGEVAGVSARHRGANNLKVGQKICALISLCLYNS